MWEVEYTEEFDEWWQTLEDAAQRSINRTVLLLEQRGINLQQPYSSGITGSKYSHMRELRIQHIGEPYRILYAFDPRRSAILLIGGNKTGDDRWYEKFIPVADKLYEEHLRILKKEGLIHG